MAPYSTFRDAAVASTGDRERNLMNRAIVLMVTAAMVGTLAVLTIVSNAHGNTLGEMQSRTVLLASKGSGTVGIAAKPRLQKLMPLEVSRDVKDVYSSKEGDVEERADIKDMFGSFERTPRDLRLESEMRSTMDTTYDEGSAPQFGALGGVGAATDMAAPGGTQTAWYGNWWNGMKPNSIVEGVESMTGLRNIRDGRNKLVDAGINVDGWEPGRSERQVISDQRSGKSIPPGFWTADGREAQAADLDVHHPCGSPLRQRPCSEDQEIKDPVDRSKSVQSPKHIVDAWSPINGVQGPVWVDPVPKAELEANHEAMQRAKTEAARAKALAAAEAANTAAIMAGEVTKEGAEAEAAKAEEGKGAAKAEESQGTAKAAAPTK